MALTISESGGGNYEQVPVGTHNATSYMLVDVGTHDETFEGETKKRHSIFIYWELNDIKMTDGRPFSIMKQYTLSLNEAWVSLPSWVQTKVDESFEMVAVNRKRVDNHNNEPAAEGDFKSLESLNDTNVEEKRFPSADELAEDDLPF